MAIVNQAPKLIVTCRTGHVELCMHEIGNVLYVKDPGLKITESGFQDVLFVYTNLAPEKAYAVVAHREYGFVEGIIPVNCVLKVPLVNVDIEKCLESLKPLGVVKLKVRSRGVREASSKLFRLFAELLKKHGSNHSASSRICLYVEVFPENVYIGLGSCQPVFKAMS